MLFSKIRGGMDMELTRAKARAWAEVDEDALLDNYRLARSLCDPEVEMMCVVKANAYGLGLRRTAETLWEAGARWFAVSAPEEALCVRQALPEARILVMSPAEESYLPALIRERVSLTVGTAEDGKKASQAAAQAGLPARVHIKLDTGLHRLGFLDASEAETIRSLPGLEMEGIFSHLALRNPEQTRRQIACFRALADQWAEKGVHPPMRHLLDSIGLTRCPDAQWNAVRVGAFLYGNVPPAWERFREGKNVLTFKARVTRVAMARAGDAVGYDDEPLRRDTLVATLSAGYIDGYPRALSGKGCVCIRGGRAKVLGLVCMDQMMVDVTDVPGVREGDEATLLGGEIDLREYAACCGLNRNECLGIIGRRVPRVYLRGGKPVAVCAEMEAEI